MALLFIKQVKNPGNIADFEAGVKEISAAIGVNADDLMTVMYFESRLNPQAKNPYGSATGLIQFTEDTARRLGTSTAALKQMTAVQQLPYVKKYLLPYSGRVSNLGKLYMAVFYPAYIGKALNDIIPLSQAWVNANKYLDVDGNGKITVAEIYQRIYDFQKQQANKLGYVIGGTGVALLLIAAYLILK